MPNDFELMQLHVRALFTHNAESRLVFVNEPNGAQVPAPRFFLGRTPIGSVWNFRADVPERIVKELAALCADEPPIVAGSEQPPSHLDEFIRLLERQSPIRKFWGGPAYRFTEFDTREASLTSVTENNKELLAGGFEDLINDVAVEQPFVALIVENRAVSVCRSVRITSAAHEAGLETLPAFRGQGYARDVTTAWARQVRAGGAIPLYSTSWENKASQAVARKLGLSCYGSDFEII